MRARSLVIDYLQAALIAVVLSLFPGLSVTVYAWLCLVVFILAIGVLIALTWRHVRHVTSGKQ